MSEDIDAVDVTTTYRVACNVAKLYAAFGAIRKALGVNSIESELCATLLDRETKALIASVVDDITKAEFEALVNQLIVDIQDAVEYEGEEVQENFVAASPALAITTPTAMAN